MNGTTRAMLGIRTPEGVTLPFEIGGAADRMAALAIDITLVMVTSAAVSFVGWMAAGGRDTGVPGALMLLVSFVLRNFYFTISELRRSGTTIGKRRFGLRVISRDGGPLTPAAVFARNLTREVEIFLPIAALFQPRLLLPDLPGWGAAIGVLWLVAFALLPLLNRERLRVGDVLAGTVVVRMPRVRLLEDVATMADVRAPTGASPAERYTFRADQLDEYGIHELQVLEDVLRRGENPREAELLEAVAEKIKARIDWPRDEWDVDTWAFLSSFYKAQRARLEHRMLFGDRRERKRE